MEQGGSWCSERGWSMPYGVMLTAKGWTVRCSLWGWMSLRRATACVWECPLLIHRAAAYHAAGFRQSVMMPVIVRLLVASNTLVGGQCGLRGGCGPCVVLRVGVRLLGQGCVRVRVGLLVGAVCRVNGAGPSGWVMDCLNVLNRINLFWG